MTFYLRLDLKTAPVAAGRDVQKRPIALQEFTISHRNMVPQADLLWGVLQMYGVWVSLTVNAGVHPGQPQSRLFSPQPTSPNTRLLGSDVWPAGPFHVGSFSVRGQWGCPLLGPVWNDLPPLGMCSTPGFWEGHGTVSISQRGPRVILQEWSGNQKNGGSWGNEQKINVSPEFLHLHMGFRFTWAEGLPSSHCYYDVERLMWNLFTSLHPHLAALFRPFGLKTVDLVG